MPESHDNTHLAQGIKDFPLREWCINLVKDVTAFTTDNASNIVQAIKKVTENVHLPGTGHAPNLSIQKEYNIPSVQKIVARLKKLVEYFNKSQPHQKELEKSRKCLVEIAQVDSG